MVRAGKTCVYDEFLEIVSFLKIRLIIFPRAKINNLSDFLVITKS